MNDREASPPRPAAPSRQVPSAVSQPSPSPSIAAQPPLISNEQWDARALAFRDKYRFEPSEAPLFRYRATLNSGQVRRFETRENLIKAVAGLTNWRLSKLLRGDKVAGHDWLHSIVPIHEDWAGNSLPQHPVSLSFYRREMDALRDRYEAMGKQVPGHKMRDITCKCWQHFRDLLSVLNEQRPYACTAADPL